jgi:hypothetical protein
MFQTLSEGFGRALGRKPKKTFAQEIHWDLLMKCMSNQFPFETNNQETTGEFTWVPFQCPDFTFEKKPTPKYGCSCPGCLACHQAFPRQNYDVCDELWSTLPGAPKKKQLCDHCTLIYGNSFATAHRLDAVLAAVNDVFEHVNFDVKKRLGIESNDKLHPTNIRLMQYRWRQIVSQAQKAAHYCVVNSINGHPSGQEEFVTELRAPLKAKPLIGFKDIGHSVLALVWSCHIYDGDLDTSMTDLPCDTLMAKTMNQCGCRGCVSCRPLIPRLNHDVGLDPTEPTKGEAESYCGPCLECLSYDAGSGKALTLLIPIILDALLHVSAEAARKPAAAFETLEQHRDNIVSLMKYRCEQLFSLAFQCARLRY